MTRLNALCDIQKGKMNIIRRDRFAKAVEDLPSGRYSIILEKIFPKRSNQQNKSYWGYAYRILQEGFIDLGWENVDIEFVHEWAKANCLPAEYVERIKSEHEANCLNKSTGEIINAPFRLTTAKMTTIEGMEYLKNMQRLGAELLGVNIPDPNELT